VACSGSCYTLTSNHAVVNGLQTGTSDILNSRRTAIGLQSTIIPSATVRRHQEYTTSEQKKRNYTKTRNTLPVKPNLLSGHQHFRLFIREAPGSDLGQYTSLFGSCSLRARSQLLLLQLQQTGERNKTITPPPKKVSRSEWAPSASYARFSTSQNPINDQHLVCPWFSTENPHKSRDITVN